ncbi:MAG: hypothetical protein ACYDA2_04235 [Acidimicrobiales bacterium]
MKRAGITTRLRDGLAVIIVAVIALRILAIVITPALPFLVVTFALISVLAVIVRGPRRLS